MSGISANYRELLPEEVHQVAIECAEAWKAEMIPIRQWELAAKKELEHFRQTATGEPFETFVKCLKRLPIDFLAQGPTLLDVGASGGYYGEVLEVAGLFFQYTGCDFSPSFKALANELYPGFVFDVADARRLPYADESFDVVVNGACMMHNAEYAKVLSESARVAKSYVLLHRTPVLTTRPTTFFKKEAYGIPCLEVHFNESELFELFRENRLSVIWSADVFWESNRNFGHRDYLLEKLA